MAGIYIHIPFCIKILNKKNVDEVISYQDKLIENWKINNFQTAELYKEI